MLIYTSNNNVLAAIKHFYLEIKKVKDTALKDAMISFNSDAINLLSLLDIEKIFISITSFESIFYRFKLYNMPYEFKWNVFPTSDEEENSTLIVYKNNYKENSYYGSVSELYETITNILNEKPEQDFANYPSGFSIENTYAEELSLAFSSY